MADTSESTAAEEVRYTVHIPMFTDEETKKVLNLEDSLSKQGITFDTVALVGIPTGIEDRCTTMREWYLDTGEEVSHLQFLGVCLMEIGIEFTVTITQRDE